MLKRRIIDGLSDIITNYSQSKGIVENLNFTTEVPPCTIAADFAVNAAMLIAKKIGTNPKIVAQELIDVTLKEMPELIEKAEIAGPGFINIYVKNEILYDELRAILREKDGYGAFPENSKETIMLEFVSANPTGPLHIGHGRGAAIGDSLARILKYLGYNVVKEYYLNDVGNQTLVLAKSAEMRYRQLKGENIDFPSDLYQGGYIADIVKHLICEGKNIYEIDFKYETIKYILNTIKEDLKNFGVEFDNWFSESDVAVVKDADGKTVVGNTCEYLLAKKYAYVKDGALWLASSMFGDDKDRVLKRSDGRYTYLASDAAYHKNKFERGFAKLINLWGADHHGYVARIKACVEMLGFDKEKLNIILYQLVSLVRDGRPVAMSTRSGEFVTLKEVVDEVGKDVCRFFFLLRSGDSQLEFDLELAKKQSAENPVFYVQYVNARCSSILEESKNRGDIARNVKDIDFSLLNTKEERDLMKRLAAFCDALDFSKNTAGPHHLAVYLMELADAYHKFYEKCRILTDNAVQSSARLKLIEGVMTIIKNGLNLLGVSTPDKM